MLLDETAQLVCRLRKWFGAVDIFLSDTCQAGAKCCQGRIEYGTDEALEFIDHRSIDADPAGADLDRFHGFCMIMPSSEQVASRSTTRRRAFGRVLLSKWSVLCILVRYSERNFSQIIVLSKSHQLLNDIILRCNHRVDFFADSNGIVID